MDYKENYLDDWDLVDGVKRFDGFVLYAKVKVWCFKVVNVLVFEVLGLNLCDINLFLVFFNRDGELVGGRNLFFFLDVVMYI